MAKKKSGSKKRAAKKKKRTARSGSSSKRTTRKKASAKSSGRKVSRKKPAKKQAPAKKRGAKKKRAATQKKTPAKKKRPARSGQRTSSSLDSRLRRLDRDILKLVNERTSATVELLKNSGKSPQALFDPRADDDLWHKLQDTNRGPLSMPAVRGIFREILSSARRQVKTLRVVYLGPPFSFTHLAAIERFGERADLIPVNTIAAVFEEVNRGHADYGLVPIENSTDGRVVDTLDMFTRLPLRICGEVQISVHHNLLARCARSEITEVYSKPQALSQCRDWLARNMPQSRLIEVTSTSTAAQLARDKPGAGAVASRQAAVEYDLQILADNIEDNANNVTRFAVIGEDVSPATGTDRTSLMMQIPHKPGSLVESLNCFKKNRINLTWIESFPLRGPETGYLFFLDFEGHVKDGRVKRTLQDLQKKTVRLEVLGSYPRSEPLD